LDIYRHKIHGSLMEGVTRSLLCPHPPQVCGGEGEDAGGFASLKQPWAKYIVLFLAWADII
jgi:hypothetical protein